MKRAFIAALVVVCGLAATAAAAELKPGDACPAFSMVGSDGQTYSLDSLKGKAFVIAWFPKAFTGGCTAECKSMREFGDQLRQYEVAYFTASCDDQETNARFAESLSLDYPILCDPTRTVSDAFGILGPNRNALRVTFYVGADGKILHIDSPNADQSTSPVRTQSHGADIAARLEALGVAKK